MQVPPQCSHGHVPGSGNDHRERIYKSATSTFKKDVLENSIVYIYQLMSGGSLPAKSANQIWTAPCMTAVYSVYVLEEIMYAFEF